MGAHQGEVKSRIVYEKIYTAEEILWVIIVRLALCNESKIAMGIFWRIDKCVECLGGNKNSSRAHIIRKKTPGNHFLSATTCIILENTLLPAALHLC